MGKKLLPLLSIGLLSVTFVACNSASAPAAPATTPATTTPTATTTPAATTTPVVIAMDKLPFDYPAVKADVKAGDTVLAPSRSMIDESLKASADSTIMYIYYNAKVVSTNDKTTMVTEASGDNAEIPNALIIPVKSGETAKTGDTVLTWWQSGSGMQRAMVVEGGKTPKVNYLDTQSPMAAETLKADTFTVLSADWQVGTTIACKATGGYDKLILVNVAGDKVLTSGWAGAMAVHNKSECQAVPVKTSVKAGDTVYVAPFGTFQKATVTSVDAANGKFKAKYDFGGSSTEEDFSFGDVLMSMPN